MQVISINVGKPRLLEGRSFSGTTGIFKEPVDAPTRVDTLGIEGDAVLDEKHHGGPDQAVYLYRSEDYDWWSQTLGRQLAPGSFGDNMTVAGLPDPGLPIGSRLCFPEVDLEVTAPRIPCNTLAERMGDAGFVRQFVRAERPGVYCRVLRTGTVSPGQPFTLETDGLESVTTLDMFRAAYRKLDRAELERFLAAPIDIRTRTDFEAKLKSLASAD